MIEIRFYRRDAPYGIFSNFSLHPVDIDGKEWPTAEHYFQAQKFAGTEHVEEIRRAPSAAMAARKGRERSRPLRTNWEAVKDSVMFTAVQAKVAQHQSVGEVLLSTGNARLVEHTTKDRYWADGGDGSGLNRLGETLMAVRTGLPDYRPVFFLPQWLAHPGIHPYDMFWRMGVGEDYVMQLAVWLDSLSPAARREWHRYFPPPPEWREAERTDA